MTLRKKVMTEKVIGAVGVFILSLTLSGCGETEPTNENETITISTEMTAPELTQYLIESGASEDEAISQAESQGLTVRVASRDGEMFPMTMDYRDNRINITVENNKVVDATIG